MISQISGLGIMPYWWTLNSWATDTNLSRLEPRVLFQLGASNCLGSLFRFHSVRHRLDEKASSEEAIDTDLCSAESIANGELKGPRNHG